MGATRSRARIVPDLRLNNPFLTQPHGLLIDGSRSPLTRGSSTQNHYGHVRSACTAPCPWPLTPTLTTGTNTEPWVSVLRATSIRSIAKQAASSKRTSGHAGSTHHKLSTHLWQLGHSMGSAGFAQEPHLPRWPDRQPAHTHQTTQNKLSCGR